MAKKTQSEPTTVPRQLPSHVGGTFAPPITDEKLESYRDLIESKANGAIKDACIMLLACVEKWWELPEAAGTKQWAHASGTGQIVKLQNDHTKILFDSIPWDHELDAIQSLLDKIDPTAERDLRNAAFHLLWFVKELSLDREPLTNDKL